MKNVEGNGRIDLLGLLRQPFECQLWRTPFSSGVRIVFREVLFHELDKSLFGKSSLPCSVRLFSYGPHHRKPSSWDSSSTLEYTSETLDRRAESLPRRMAGNTGKQLNFLPRKSFQPAKDDILSDCITGCKRFSHYKISLYGLHVRILRRARQVKGFRIIENGFGPRLLSQNERARGGSMLCALEIDGCKRR
jgi:hypothetical protein